MTGHTPTLQAFADQAPIGRSLLDRVAATVTSQPAGEGSDDMLVLALRPDRDDRRVIASAGNSAVRAAISVAIAAGNLRAWSGAGEDTITDVAVGSLPEIIRSAVEPCGIRSVRVAAVRDGEIPVCLAMWLSRVPAPSAATLDVHRRVLRQLSEAAHGDRDAATAAAEAAAIASGTADDDLVDLPGLDPLSSLPSREEFDVALAALESTATALVVLAVDNLDAIAIAHGADSAEHVVRVVADRLIGECRRHDLVARVAGDTFAVLLADIDRRAAFEVSRRLQSHLSAAVADGTGLIEVSISVGLAYDDGLVDPVELFESAESAMDDARQAGGSRMLVAC